MPATATSSTWRASADRLKNHQGRRGHGARPCFAAKKNAIKETARTEPGVLVKQEGTSRNNGTGTGAANTWICIYLGDLEEGPAGTTKIGRYQRAVHRASRIMPRIELLGVGRRVRHRNVAFYTRPLDDRRAKQPTLHLHTATQPHSQPDTQLDEHTARRPHVAARPPAPPPGDCPHL